MPGTSIPALLYLQLAIFCTGACAFQSDILKSLVWGDKMKPRAVYTSGYTDSIIERDVVRTRESISSLTGRRDGMLTASNCTSSNFRLTGLGSSLFGGLAT